MKNSWRPVSISKSIRLVFAFILFPAAFYTTSYAREIIDMAGRRVIVPDVIKKVCTDSPVMMYQVYAIDPALLAGFNAPPIEQEQEYLDPRVRMLPRVSGFFGPKATQDLEALYKVKPDVVIAEIWHMDLNVPSEQRLAQAGIPVVYVKFDTVSDYPAALLFLGKLLGREKRARMLADYGENALKETAAVVNKVPGTKRPRVYFAEGIAGLNTECHTTWHVELIGLAGGMNVHRCDGPFKKTGHVAISLEQVLLYNPEVIIAEEPHFYRSVFTDARWQNIKALKTGRVYFTPKIVLNWFTHPPSFLRLLGIKWLTHCLYPDYYRIDIVKEAQKFYRLFLNIELSEETIKKALYP